MSAPLIRNAPLPSHVFAERWAKIENQIEAFRLVTERLNFIAGWDGTEPSILDVTPPASEAEVQAIETRIGTSLPARLRQFFREGAAEINVRWFLPGDECVDSDGREYDRYHLMPPPMFQEEGRHGPSPTITGSRFNLCLQDLPDVWNVWESWPGIFECLAERYAEYCGDAAVEHFYSRERFWKRAFPIAMAVNGDVFAIDLTHPGERLLLLNHESGEEPGWFLGQTLLEHLDQQSRLGFVGSDLYSLRQFENTDLSIEAQRPYEATHGDAYHRRDLFLPGGLVFDANTPQGQIWREWLFGEH